MVLLNPPPVRTIGSSYSLTERAINRNPLGPNRYFLDDFTPEHTNQEYFDMHEDKLIHRASRGGRGGVAPAGPPQAGSSGQSGAADRGYRGRGSSHHTQHALRLDSSGHAIQAPGLDESQSASSASTSSTPSTAVSTLSPSPVTRPSHLDAPTSYSTSNTTPTIHPGRTPGPSPNYSPISPSTPRGDSSETHSPTSSQSRGGLSSGTGTIKRKRGRPPKDPAAAVPVRPRPPALKLLQPANSVALSMGQVPLPTRPKLSTNISDHDSPTPSPSSSRDTGPVASTSSRGTRDQPGLRKIQSVVPLLPATSRSPTSPAPALQRRANLVEEYIFHGPTNLPPTPSSSKYGEILNPRRNIHLMDDEWDRLPDVSRRLDRLEDALQGYVKYRGDKALQRSLIPGMANLGLGQEDIKTEESEEEPSVSEALRSGGKRSRRSAEDE